MKKKSPTSFEIVIQSKAKHGILWDFVQQCGSVKAAAKEIGIKAATLSSWINLRAMPQYSSRRRSKKQEAACLKLVELTGRKIEEIFPGFVREKLSEIPRTHETRVSVDSVALANDYTKQFQSRMTLPSPDGGLINDELKERINKVLKTLSVRDREILKLRYGLMDGHTYTLEEVAHIFKVTMERIRQIEAKAVRMLMQPGRAGELVDFLD